MWTVLISLLETTGGKLLVSYWKPLLIALLAVGLYGGGYYSGYSKATAAYKLEKETAIAEAEKAVLGKEHKAETITRSASNDLQNKNSAIDANYADFIGMREQTNLPVYLPTISNGQPRPLEATCHNQLPSRSQKERLAVILKTADKQTAQLSALQTWVIQQGNVK